MTTLKQRFAELEKEKPEITQAEIARVTKAKPPSVNAWFSGVTKTMKLHTATRAAGLYGVNPMWLAQGEGPKFPPNERIHTSYVAATLNPTIQTRRTNDGSNVIEIGTTRIKNKSDEFVIPQFNAGGSMGNGLLLRDQPGLICEWTVTQEWVNKNIKSHSGIGNLCIVTGFGDSMRGMYNSGDPLLVDAGVRQVEYDAVYFFRVGNEGFIKRLQRVPGEGLVALSENKSYKDWVIKDGMDFEVMGRVLKVWQSEDL